MEADASSQNAQSKTKRKDVTQKNVEQNSLAASRRLPQIQEEYGHRQGTLSEYVAYLNKYTKFDDVIDGSDQEAHLKKQGRGYSQCKFLRRNGSETQRFKDIQSGRVASHDRTEEEKAVSAAKKAKTHRERELGQLHHYETRGVNAMRANAFLGEFDIIAAPDGAQTDVVARKIGAVEDEWAAIELKCVEAEDGKIGVSNIGPDHFLPSAKYHGKTAILFISSDFNAPAVDGGELTAELDHAFVFTGPQDFAHQKKATTRFAATINGRTSYKNHYRLQTEEEKEAFRLLIAGMIEAAPKFSLEDIFFSVALNPTVTPETRTELDGIHGLWKALRMSGKYTMTFPPEKNEATDFIIECGDVKMRISAKTAGRNGGLDNYQFKKNLSKNHGRCMWVFAFYMQDASPVRFSVIDAHTVYFKSTTKDSFSWNMHQGTRVAGVRYPVPEHPMSDLVTILDRMAITPLDGSVIAM